MTHAVTVIANIMLMFCLQITTIQIELTTQERQNYVLPSDNNNPIEMTTQERLNKKQKHINSLREDKNVNFLPSDSYCKNSVPGVADSPNPDVSVHVNVIESKA